MYYIKEKDICGRKISKIKSLDDLNSFKKVEKDSIFLRFRKGANPNIDYNEITTMLYEILKKEYLESGEKNPKTLKLIEKVDSLLASKNL